MNQNPRQQLNRDDIPWSWFLKAAAIVTGIVVFLLFVISVLLIAS